MLGIKSLLLITAQNSFAKFGIISTLITKKNFAIFFQGFSTPYLLVLQKNVLMKSNAEDIEF